MSNLTTWKTQINAKLDADITTSHAYPIIDAKSEVEQNAWADQDLMFEFVQGNGGDHTLYMGTGAVTYEVPLNVYVCIRNIDVDAALIEEGPLVHAADRAHGVYELIDSVITSLSFLELTGVSPSPNPRVIFKNWTRWATGAYTVIYQLQFRIAGATAG